MSALDGAKKVVYLLPDPNHFSRGRGGAVSHAIGVVNGLHDAGWSVELLCEEGVLKYRAEIRSAVKVVPISKCSSASNRPFQFLQHAVRILMERSSFDQTKSVLLVRKNVTTLLYLWLVQHKLRGAYHFVYEVNGLTFERFRGRPLGNFLHGLGALLNRLGIRHADLVYVVNRWLQRDLCTGPLALDPDKVVVVPNGGPDPVHRPVTPRLEDAGVREAAPLRLLFFGKFQPYNDFLTVVRGFRMLRQKGYSAELHFVGFGAEERSLRELCNGDPQITFWGESRLHQLYLDGIVNSRTVGLVPLRLGRGAEYLSPIKMYDYFALGLPVVYSAIPSLVEELEGHAGCFSYKAEDVESFVDVLSKLAENPALLVEASRSISHMYQEYTWSSRMKRLGQAIETLAMDQARA